jgi:transcriptional regulator with XRE-family HTH domain
MDSPVIVTEVELRGVATPGGARLRKLREARGRTQLWVEVKAGIGTGYLQRVESGRVAQPSRGTVERILNALDARYDEVRAVLELFGYTAAMPLPSEAERAWAKETCQCDLNHAAFPAYTLDCAARLVAWNTYLPRLLGLPPDASLPSGMARRSMLFSWFDPATPLGATVLDPETLHPALARALRYELERYRGEAWTRELLAPLRTLPRFRAVWEDIEQAPPPVAAARARVPIRLRAGGTGRLEFRLAAESLAQDPRFRIIYLFPTDLATIRWCEAPELAEARTR